MTDAGIDRAPGRTALGLAAVAALVATGAMALSGVATALGIVAVGAAVLLAGAAAGATRVLGWGTILAFGGVVFAGVGGARAAPLLVGLVGVVVAWDAGEQAINVGEQLGRAARTRRAETVHVAMSAIVGAGGAAVGYGVFRLAGGGRPASALVVLLLGGVLVTWALRS